MNEEIGKSIEDVLAQAGFGDGNNLRDEDSERVYLQFCVIPDLIEEISEKTDEQNIRDELDFIEDKITFDEIGVGIATPKLPGRVEVRPLMVDEISVSLMILVNPDVSLGLDTPDDREALVQKFKEVLLSAAEKYRRMKKEGTFVPYSKVLSD